jgi:hypothetical protein
MKHEQDEVKALQKEFQLLKLALADATLECDVLESLLEVANEYYGVDMSMLKKLRISAILHCSENKKQSINRLCTCFGISRNGYYKLQHKELKKTMEKQIIVDIVVKERRQQPRIGGRKLYLLYSDSR